MSARPASGTPRWVYALWLLPLVLRGARARLAAAALAAAVLSFFRDPERRPGGTGVLAAADGLVREVSQGEDGRWLVSTYLSLRDVHVTRAPAAVTVRAQAHRDGSHHAAFDDRAARNESLTWSLESDLGPMLLVQYSGAVARRIVPYVGTGAAVGRGERIGLIRFGSRVDVTLPPDVRPLVTVGTRVRAGTTPIAAAGAP